MDAFAGMAITRIVQVAFFATCYIMKQEWMNRMACVHLSDYRAFRLEKAPEGLRMEEQG